MNKKSRPTDQYFQEHRESIGMSLRAFREKKGYSQDDLAEIMEVHRSTISKVETGKFAITIDYLMRFAWYLDFDISVLEKKVNKMADVHAKAVRSYNMSRIRSRDTGPEIVVRKFLFAHGIRYRLYDKKLPGKPDIVIRKYKTIIDVRGCFWHGHQNCKYGDKIRSGSAGITERVRSATKRDKINEEKWQQLGWKVLIIWDSCELEIKRKKSEKREKLLTNLLKKIFDR